eukprot:8882041-Alexandrium_andersonii.AAC.1
MKDKRSGAIFAAMTQSKSAADTYTVAAAAQWLRDLGYPELDLRGAAEFGLQDKLQATKRKAGAG